MSEAIALFAQNGYHNTKTADIAKQFGLSEPAIYRHFQNKEAIAVAVVDKAWEFFQETLAGNLDGKDNTGARIGALLDTEKVLYLRPEGKVFYMLTGDAEENSELWQSLREFLTRKLELYKQIADDDYVAFRLSILIGVGVLAIVQGQQFFDATIDQLKKEFGGNSHLDIDKG